MHRLEGDHLREVIKDTLSGGAKHKNSLAPINVAKLERPLYVGPVIAPVTRGSAAKIVLGDMFNL